MAITQQQFGRIEEIYTFYNTRLFNSELSDCMLNMSRKNGAMEFFSPDRWTGPGDTKVHEISINPDTFDIEDEELHRTIIHEMCHLWQQDHGKPSRTCYHNKEWANKMIEVGLMPSHNGRPGGKTTGQRMNDYTIEGGVFQALYAELKESLKLPYYPVQRPKRIVTVTTMPPGGIVSQTVGTVNHDQKAEEVETTSGQRVKYTCPGCKVNVWGKASLNLNCGDCSNKFIVS